MAKFRVSLTTQVLLVVTIPVLVELGFFFKMQSLIDQLENDLQAEAKAVDALVLVDGIQTAAMSGAAALAMFKTLREKSFLIEAQLAFSSLEDDARSLRAIASSPNMQNSAIKEFVKAMDDINRTIESSSEFISEGSFSASSVSLIGTLRSCVMRIKQTADKTMEEQMAFRVKSQEKQKNDRESIRFLLQLATLTNAAFAAIAACVFSMGMGRRLKILTDNTVKISIDKPLNPVLRGNDELATLDRAMHNLSDELALTRKKERAILDNTAEIICTLDDALRIADITPAVEKRLGFLPEEFRGSLFQSHVHPDDRTNTHKDLSLCMTARDEISFEVRMLAKDETYRDMDVTAQWSEHDKTIFCIARDITARKQAERLKQEVIAMVSHDLRAPLTSLGITLEMILEGIAGAINEQGTRMVTIARQSVVSLIMMINDLLDMERFEATGLQLHYESFDVKPMIEQAVAVMAPESQSKNLRVVTVCDEIAVNGDNERLTRVVTNLLGNAIKFSPEGSVLRIECHKVDAADGDQSLKFEITDDGPGIPADKIDLVFEKFRQVGTRSAGEKVGSGLGLAICKSIVEAHRGSIGVRSVEGHGSTFWFIVPLSPIS